MEVGEINGGWRDLTQHFDSLMISMKSASHKKQICLSKDTSHRARPC